MPYQIVSLSNLIRSFLQPSLGGVNPPVTVVDVLLHIAHIVIIKAPFSLFRSRSKIIFRLQSFAMHLRTSAQVLLGIGEKVMRTRSREIRPADFGIGDRQLRITRRSSGADKVIRCIQEGRR